MHLFIHPFGTRSVLNNFNSIFNSVVFISRVVWDEEEEGEAEGKKRSSLHSHTCGECLLYFSDLVQNSPSYETWHHNEAALRSLLVVTGGSPRERRPRLPRARRASENAAVRQRCSTVDCCCLVVELARPSSGLAPGCCVCCCNAHSLVLRESSQHGNQPALQLMTLH